MSVCESARLSLRHMSDGDAPFIVALLNDPDFLRNVGDRGVRNEDDARRYIAQGPQASYARYGFGLWLAELRPSAVAIGMCGLLRRDTHPDVEIGFAFLPPYRGRGYASEAAQATMQLATHNLGLSRVVAITALDNAASGAILEKLGFRFERLVHYTADGESRLFVFERPLD
jgi:[ribosomal protein S5]-alanine N-acetyltransferase